MMFSRISAFAKASRFAAFLGLGALILGSVAPVFTPVVAQAQGAEMPRPLSRLQIISLLFAP